MSILEFDATLVLPLADQHGTRKIDPDGVVFDPDDEYPVSWNFDLNRVIGKAKVSRAEDGSLVASGVLFEYTALKKTLPKLAIGVTSTAVLDEWWKGGTLLDSVVSDMALCERHADPNHPSIVIRSSADS